MFDCCLPRACTAQGPSVVPGSVQLLCYRRELLLKWLRVPAGTPLSDPLALLACMSGCDFVTDAATAYLQLRVEQVLRAGSRRNRGVKMTRGNLTAGTAGCTYVRRVTFVGALLGSQGP